MLRSVIMAIIFFIIGLWVGLYLPHLPAYHPYADKVNRAMGIQAMESAMPAKTETSTTEQKNP